MSKDLASTERGQGCVRRTLVAGEEGNKRGNKLAKEVMKRVVASEDGYQTGERLARKDIRKGKNSIRKGHKKEEEKSLQQPL